VLNSAQTWQRHSEICKKDALFDYPFFDNMIVTELFYALSSLYHPFRFGRNVVGNRFSALLIYESKSA